ncbi:MRP-L47-domain-containing protein [Thelephora ganbajun]|uniref:MRP-L47-domain-containing protein n=1 Tax=Thelephora ganbajun TaxID=370292 RepID=A0ACB6ZKV6_THEGA|nr:MRP-L47-domain-containing protein [Thelephora ganbajun]
MLKTLRTSTTLLSFQLLASRSAPSSLALRVQAHTARSYATETALPSTSSTNPVASVEKGNKSKVSEGPLRPHLGVEVNPNHGLWALFRKKVGKDGMQSYETLEANDSVTDYSGRAWAAAELRRKSFKDLHTLWYLVLRERNLLQTQLLETKRLGALLDLTPIRQHMFRCRKTMARIKYVINERRLAYEGAIQIITEGSEREVLTRRERTAARREATLEAKVRKTEEQQAIAPGSEFGKAEEPPVVVHRTAAERAAAGLIQPDLVRR